MEIYLSRRNVPIYYQYNADGIIRDFKDLHNVTLQMNVCGGITYPHGPAWCIPTGVIEDGYRKCVKVLSPYDAATLNGRIHIEYIVWVEDTAFQELNNKRRQKWTKESM